MNVLPPGLHDLRLLAQRIDHGIADTLPHGLHYEITNHVMIQVGAGVEIEDGDATPTLAFRLILALTTGPSPERNIRRLGLHRRLRDRKQRRTA